MFFENQENNF